MTRTLKRFMNLEYLEYLEIRHVPSVESKRCGHGTDAEVLKKVEFLVVKALLSLRRPLHSTEVLFFRSVLGIGKVFPTKPLRWWVL